MSRILTGIQSTGTPHLGNLLGAIIPAIKMANDSKNESYLFIADMHSVTQIKDAEQLRLNTYSTAACWLAFGLNYDKTIFYRQSDVPQVTELAWYLNCYFPYQRLTLAHSFKDKSNSLEDINAATKVYNVDLVGGDTTSSKSGLTISVTAIGEVDEKDIVYRNGAKQNDLLVVTGDLGSAYMGLKVLERENEVFKVNPNNQPELDQYTYLVERQLKPESRRDIIKLLKDLEVKPTSMIDISDGLSSEIMHICSQSNVGCDLYEEKIPIDPQLISTCEEFNIDSTTIALNGGEDYELLFTICQQDYLKIKANPNFTVIGHITDKNSTPSLVTRSNSKIPLKAQGWNSIN